MSSNHNNSDKWVWDQNTNQICLVLERSLVWGLLYIKAWFPELNEICFVNSQALQELSTARTNILESITLIPLQARIIDTLSQDELLSPILSSVIPLPHQLNVLATAVRDGRYRLLLADEVGLGKTIEAGLIMRELKLRGLAKRVLVVVPKGLVAQWVAEMKTHFNEDFRFIQPSNQSNKYQSSPTSIWEEHNNIVCSMDSVKPIESRKGWNRDQIKEYNKSRFEDLINAKWDLVIIDEAHRMGGSLDVIARYRLGKALSSASPYFLMLSATPHQGKTEAFFRLMQLLDPDSFPNLASISRQRLQPFVIRTEKRKAIDADGEKLFKPRVAHLYPVNWEQRHSQHRLLYENVSNYVIDGYNKAIEEKMYYQAFLMILMQRLVTSSTRAIAGTLTKRLQVIESFEETMIDSTGSFEDDWNELDGQSLVDELLQKRIKANEEELHEIKSLIKLAEQCEKISPDAKADALLSLLLKLQQEENSPNLKVLLFTEFMATQIMLQEILEKSKYQVVCLNGSMDLDERLEAQEKFAKSHQILISTDAGGEGINLQFCHIVINYDLPWNPMRIEQRIGRVDRIGQVKAVKAFNFVLKDTVEYRVREVLEDKLAVILKDLGIDKASDVLDAAFANEVFDELYMNALRNPDDIEDRVTDVVNLVQKESSNCNRVNELLNNYYDVDSTAARKLKSHPLPYWVERMTIAYIRYKGGFAESDKHGWNLTWADGTKMHGISFRGSQGTPSKSKAILSLDHPKIQDILNLNTRFFPGQRVATVTINAIPKEISGYFSIWQITLSGLQWKKKRFLPIFLHEDGRSLNVTARAIWDHFLLHDAQNNDSIEILLSESILQQHFTESEKQGHPIWLQLSNEYSEYLEREKQKREYLYTAKLKALDEVGLENVKASRMAKLHEEKSKSDVNLQEMKQTVPELYPVLFVYIRGAE